MGPHPDLPDNVVASSLGEHVRGEVLVGRDQELARLQSFVADARALPAGIVLEGEPGIGKTALWRHGLTLATQAGFQVISTRATQTETAFSYVAIGDLVEGAWDEVAATLGPSRRNALAAALLRDATPTNPPDARAVALAVLDVLRLLAVHSPLLVAIDDVQWLDEASATAIGFAARRLRDEPVAFLLTRRVEREAPDAPRLLPDELLERVQVGVLDLSALHTLLERSLAMVLPRPKLRAVHELSRGNPLFALEIARTIGDRQANSGEPLPVPRTLRALVRERVAALPSSAADALFAAAAAVDPTLGLLEAASGHTATDWLSAAIAADIVELIGDRVRFTHPLLASAAYEAPDSPRRRVLHRALAGLVADPEERARHLALAADGPDEDIARALEQAAHHAHARGAPAAAAGLAEQARTLTPSAATLDEAGRAVVAARFHWEAGDSARACVLLEDLIATLPAGSERGLALYLLGRVRALEDLDPAAALCRRGLAEADDEGLVAAAVHVGLAGILFRLRRDLVEAAEHARVAERLGRRHGDLATQAEAVENLLLIDTLLGGEQAPQHLDDARALQRRCGHLRVMVQPDFGLGCVQLWTDQPDLARDTFHALRKRCAELGDESSLPYVLVMLGQVECARADFGAALAHAHEGLEAAREGGQAALEAYLLGLRALALAHLGEQQATRGDAARALQLATRTAGKPAEFLAVPALGMLELSLGQARETAGHLRPLARFVHEEGIVEPGAIRFVVDLVEALVELGRGDEAKPLLSWYEGHAQRIGRVSALAASSRCRALLAGADGDLTCAREHLEHALDLHERVNLPFERARTVLALGVAQRRAKERRAARDTLNAALAEFERFRAAIWAERARAELARIGGRAPSSGELTPVERRIAELVTAGQTNREIAATLFLSARTVEGHLSRIYAKLQVRSRTELAGRFRGDA